MEQREGARGRESARGAGLESQGPRLRDEKMGGTTLCVETDFESLLKGSIMVWKRGGSRGGAAPFGWGN